MAKKAPKTYETENAIYYDTPGQGTAIILDAVLKATENITGAFMKAQARKDIMKETMAQLDFEQRTRLYESMSERDRKFYNLKSAPTETAGEKTARLQREANLTQTNVQTEGQKIANVREGLAAKSDELSLQEKSRQSAIVNDPQANLWDKAFALGYRGEDAEKYVLNKKFPEFAEESLLVRNKVGPKYEAMLTSEYFKEFTDTMGIVDPKYTLATSKALAAAVARGDTKALDKLNEDPGFPKAMRTLAYRRYVLDQDQMQEARTQRLSSERQARGQFTIRLMEMFEGQIGPQAAQAGADAILQGKPTPDWIKPKLEAVMQMKDEVQKAQSAKLRVEMAEKMNGIPEIRSTIDSLRQLQSQGIGDDNEKQIDLLKNTLFKRLGNLYGIEPEEYEPKDSIWRSIFTGSVNYAVASGQLAGAVTTDVMAMPSQTVAAGPGGKTAAGVPATSFTEATGLSDLAGTPVPPGGGAAAASAASRGGVPAPPPPGAKVIFETEARQIMDQLANPAMTAAERTKKLGRLRELRQLVGD